MYEVELIVDCPGLNPAFDPAEAMAAAEAGEPYDVPRKITIPAGTRLVDRRAHFLCQTGHMNTPAVAIPINEAAKRKHAEYLKLRPQLIAGLRAQLKHPPRKKQAREHLMRLARAYNVTADENVEHPTSNIERPTPKV
jgi:hypothetical protein